MDSEYVVVSIAGPVPQAAPTPHVASRFLRVGQTLDEGDDYLMLSGATVVLVDDAAGEVVTVRGPNRFQVRTGHLDVAEPGGVTRHEPAYFADPASAVAQTAQWLSDGSWLRLAVHYDLSGTDIPLSSLLTGSFFLREELPEVGHPGGFARFKEPFSPSFSYDAHRTLEEGRIEVTVRVSIDQGGGMVQEGRDTFFMQRSDEGFQLLPAPSR